MYDAIVAYIRPPDTSMCYVMGCEQHPDFFVWADWENEDFEHGDEDPLATCSTHLPGACRAKMNQSGKTGPPE